MIETEPLIELRGGPVVREAAIALGCLLERRGHVLTAHGTALHVSDANRLTEADRDAIRAHRVHLVAAVAYQAPPLAPDPDPDDWLTL